MDAITHGLAGALIGKAFFSAGREARPEEISAGRVATFAATLGAVFPDADVIAGIASRNDLAVIEIHRNVTHSLLCLPVFAAALAALTHWLARRRSLESPGWLALTAICAVGLASHILLDLATSFGTMVWSPWKYTRVSWDLAFIVDFTMTAIVLLPQAAAWVYRKPERSLRRAWRLWALFTIAGVLVEQLSRAAGFPFSPWALLVVALLLAALFFLPRWQGRGFSWPHRSWCRAGVYALIAYLCVCAAAHWVALGRVEQFVASHSLHVEQAGALPIPPSAAHWAGLIRTPDGVYAARFMLFSRQPVAFAFFADSPPNAHFQAAEQLPRVQKYLWFARFPVFRFRGEGDEKIVEISDLRFTGRRSRVSAFTFRVRFDAAGRVLEQGWAKD